MDKCDSDKNKENIANCDAKDLFRNVKKTSTSQNANFCTLQKVHKVLTEAGINVNMDELLSLTSGRENSNRKTDSGSLVNHACEKMISNDSNSSPSTLLVKTFDMLAINHCDEIFENVLDDVLATVERKMTDQKKDVIDADVLVINAVEMQDVKMDKSPTELKDMKDNSCPAEIPKKNIILPRTKAEKKVFSDSNPKVSNNRINETDLSKEEREDIVSMEEIDLGVDFSQQCEIETCKDTHVEEIKVEETKAVHETKCKKLPEKTVEEPVKQSLRSKNLWVTNITSITRAADLKLLFSKYGKVIGAKIVTDGWSRCYGYIVMASNEDAEKCLKKLNKHEVNGKKIGVSKSKPERLSPKMKKTEVSVTKKVPLYIQPKEEIVRPSSKRKLFEENPREKREMERLMIKKRKLDDEAKVLRDESMRLRKIALKQRKIQRKLDDGREQLRVDREELRIEKEQFEKEKCEIMSLERERQRREREHLEKEKFELVKMKREIKKLKTENVTKTPQKMIDGDHFKSPLRRREVPKVEDRRPIPVVLNKREVRKSLNYELSKPSPSYHHGPVGEKCNDYNSKPLRKSSEYERPKSNYGRVTTVNLPKSLDYDRGYKEEKSGSFGSVPKSTKRCPLPHSSAYESSWKQTFSPCVGGGGVSKSYQQVTKGVGWGEDHSWRVAPAAPAPPRIGWSSGGGGRISGDASGGYGGNYTSRAASSSSGIVCPAPPGVNYGGKFEGEGYGYWKKY